ncbi:cytochrome c oxidase assembly factor 1 homolog [Actinia tenebrosa]|uniref:Cytochrome c oxidase assembly factor 1 homolog n=1 Tax=Actinia tenebrosa TaxID=6105 RepID=A0A6P8ILW7_ACTTE|nr:cytochrome c oxidase assembly factor 1 homolog [Actinia tenebrosa]
MTVEILKKCAVYGAVVAVVGAAFCHHRIQANLASMDYYKKSVDEFRKHPVAVEAVGNPVRFRYMNLGRKDIQVDHERAQIVIPVRGSKTTGNLFSFATRQSLDEQWVLKELELEVESDKKRITIIKNDEDEVTSS